MNEKDVIFRYTREQAISDGVLVDVSDLAREAGFVIPVAITAGVHELCQPPDKTQDYTGRLWDVLFLAAVRFRAALKKGEKEARLVEYQVGFRMSEDRMVEETLWLVFNEYEGFTIMKPEEY